MNKYREQLVDRMIRMYGHEDPEVVSFAKTCETDDFTDEELEQMVVNHEQGYDPTPYPKMLEVIHYVGVFCTGMLFGGAVTMGLFNAGFIVGICLGTALSIATKIAIKENQE